MSDAPVLESDVLEEDDVRILRALQISPRLPFAPMASVLGLTERTVTRRYRRMSREGVLRVAGILDPGALGQTKWVVRVRTRPGGAAAIAGALAKRDDVSWVALCAGGVEVSAVVRSRTPEQRADLLGCKLPRETTVVDFSAVAMMRQFVGGRGHYWTAMAGVLSPQEETALGSGGAPLQEGPVVRREPVQLTDVEERLLESLSRDGRASLVDLAAAADISSGRASRRLDSLLERRVVHIDVEIAAAALGLRAQANLWLRVHPSAVKRAGRALAQEPEIAFVTAVSGVNNLHAVAQCRDLDDLFEFTSDRVGAMPGVEALEVSPLVRHVKQAGSVLTGDRLSRQ